MLEKDMENLIANYPDEFFSSSGLKLICQQYRLHNRFIDIVFKDKYDRTIFIEIKKGILSRDAAGQIMEYYGLLKKEKPEIMIELILCANTITSERREFLERNGIECKETGIIKFDEVARKVGYKFIENEKIKEPANPKKEQSSYIGIADDILFQNFKKWLLVYLIESKKFSSLGSRTSFDAKYNEREGSLTIVNSHQNVIKFKDFQIESIFKKWKGATPSDKYKSSYYQRQNWNDVPNKYRPFNAPAIPAIIKYWINNDQQ